IHLVEDTSKIFDLIASDPDGDPVTCSVVEFPVNGSFELLGRRATYKPVRNFFGMDYLTYAVTDSMGAVTHGVVTFAVAGASEAPLAFDQRRLIHPNTPREIELLGEDPDGGSLS